LHFPAFAADHQIARGYAGDLMGGLVLTSMTQGRGSFTMEFSHYDYLPQLQADKVIAAAKAAKAGEEEEEE
jgi:hypothetical protein